MLLAEQYIASVFAHQSLIMHGPFVFGIDSYLKQFEASNRVCRRAGANGRVGVPYVVLTIIARPHCPCVIEESQAHGEACLLRCICCCEYSTGITL